jgi:hypothetical protein
MLRVLLITIFIYSPFASSEEVGWDVYFSDHEWASISGKHHSGHSLSKAIELVPKELWLKSFRIFPAEEDVEFQKEVHNFLAINYPQLHEQALNSAGNMHNPKVKALRGAFQQAIMSSSLVAKINTLLKSRCERVTSTSYEKFTIIKNNGQPIYSAMVWLSTEKCT